ncbi:MULTISPECIES: DUF3972 domain-containing protein [unclassified Helicobacter]|uniref:DUF3972 domain-containing protein n=1 Tax=unclassified Helicobacter TaxID=2593540 RepID=UPI000CF18C00|nr:MULTISPECIES: DUF3972 domain-containing protein [unclassified Helicobacter]
MSLVAFEDFYNLTGISEEELDLNILKIRNEKKYIEPTDAINLFLKKIENQLLAIDMNGGILEPIFLERSIQAITFFYEALLKNKIEGSSDTLGENQLLKNTLVSLQEECQSYQNKIQELQKELFQKNEEIEFLNRKYKLMWGKVSNIGGLKD